MNIVMHPLLEAGHLAYWLFSQHLGGHGFKNKIDSPKQTE